MEATSAESSGHRAHPRARPRVSSGWLALVPFVLVSVAWLWGRTFGIQIALGDTPPIVGHFDPRIGVGAVGALALGPALLWWGPVVAERSSWHRLMGAVFLAAFGWAIALALIRGTGAITGPISYPSEYLNGLSHVHGVGSFLSGYASELGHYGPQLKGHPPGITLVFWSLAQVGLGGAWPAALLLIAGGAAAAPAALIAFREIAGEAAARRAAPFLVLAPAAIWIATSADALFMGVTAASVALLVHATGAKNRRADLSAFLGGLLYGVSVFFSYGMVLIAVIPLAVAFKRQIARPILIGAGAALLVAAAFLAAGFWWLDGLRATREQYMAGIASVRPYDFFAVSNLAGLGILLGPATFVGLGRLRDRRAWLLIGAGLGAVGLAELSGMSKGEAERIWLPFTPWILLAGCAVAVRLSRTRIWLALQAVTALTVMLTVNTKW